MPAENIAFFKGNAFFERFPFFLPCLVISIITLIDLVFAVFYLKESKVWTPEDEERRIALTPAKPGTPKRPKPPSEFKIILRNRTFCIVCVAYGAYGFCWQAFNEVFPIWATNSNKVGGPHFASTEVGSVQGVAGLGSLVASGAVHYTSLHYNESYNNTEFDNLLSNLSLNSLIFILFSHIIFGIVCVLYDDCSVYLPHRRGVHRVAELVPHRSAAGEVIQDNHENHKKSQKSHERKNILFSHMTFL